MAYLNTNIALVVGLAAFGCVCLAVAIYLRARMRQQIEDRETYLKNAQAVELDADRLRDMPVVKPGDIIVSQGPLVIRRIGMAHEQTDVEVEIAGILDRLGSEMLAASRRLRTAPYASVEGFVKQARLTLRRVDTAAMVMKSGNYNTALELCRLIDVPEIDFTDADEDQEVQVSDFFDSGS
jgi:hypothetical protein